MNRYIHYALTAILGVAVVVLLIHGCNQRKQRKMMEHNYSVAADSLETTVNKLGQQEATIRSFEVLKEKDFLKMETQDKTIKQLQGVVKDYKGRLLTAMVAKTETSDKGATKTVVEYVYVTVDGDVVDSVPTEFSTTWDEKWSIGSITANEDSITRDIKIRNEWQETVGYGRWNPIKRREVKIDLLNLNPNTVTKEMRSVVVKMPEHRIGVGFYAGYGVTATLDGNFHHGFQGGVGVHYRIWP